MTTITQDDVLSLAQLSSLQLDDSETASLQAELSAIVGYINQLDELDTTGVEPTYQVTGLENVWRDDVVDQPLERAALLGLAPDKTDSEIKVPKVL